MNPLQTESQFATGVRVAQIGTAKREGQKKKPTCTVVQRTEQLDDFRSLLRDIARPVENDRRAQNRAQRRLHLSVQFLDENKNPLGEPITAMTRNFSENGIGFIGEVPFDCEFIRVGPNTHSVAQSLARVCYSRGYERKGKKTIYLAGVEFLPNE